MKIVLLMSFLLLGNGAGAQADNLPNMPFDRFVEKQQKEKNVDTSLFQDDQVGDLKQKRQQKEKKAYDTLFKEETRHYQPEKKLFKKAVTRVDYTKKTSTSKKSSHYGRFVFGVSLVGVVLSIIIWWKGRYDGKRN